MNGIFVPDIEAEIIPEVGAAGFMLGDSYLSVLGLVGAVSWYESDSGIHELLHKNKGWIGVRKRLGPRGDGGSIITLTYMNSLIVLAFENSATLYQIILGDGYFGSFQGVRVGDSLSSLEKDFELDFNDDEFLVLNEGGYVVGISFITDYRASLLCAPNQTIKYISVHDWALR
ncbi:hypothetical protein HWD95_21830 [Pseudomonas corrugata]|nr:hypothetical protein [Pseudomonas corrugata]MCI0996544.1 hypothetical protein [Pseudomonas corrugata]NUT68356.1 hypothetical protein [Pseudomonas corrugata]